MIKRPIFLERKIRFRVKADKAGRGGKYHYRDEKGGKVCARPGDEFLATKSSILPFMDLFEQLDPDPPEADLDVSRLEIRRHLRTKYFDVVNPETGEALNDRPLSRRDAQELVGIMEDPLDPPFIPAKTVLEHHNLVEKDEDKEKSAEGTIREALVGKDKGSKDMGRAKGVHPGRRADADKGKPVPSPK